MSLWNAILQDCSSGPKGQQGDVQTRGIPVKKIFLVGSFYAGKRTLAARLRDVLSEKKNLVGASPEKFHHYGGEHQPEAQPAAAVTSGKGRGAGIEYSFVDVRGAEGNVCATVELYVVDAASAIPAVIPTLQAAENSMILYVCDLGEPSTALHSYATWRNIIDAHLTSLADSQSLSKADEMRNQTVRRWNETSAFFARVRAQQWNERKTQGKVPAHFELPVNTVVLDNKAVNLIPSCIVGTKLDQYSKFCRIKADVAPSAVEVRRDVVGLQILRKKALDSRSGFVSLNTLNITASGAVLKALWYWCLDCLAVPNVPYPEVAQTGDNNSVVPDMTLAGTMNMNSLGMSFGQNPSSTLRSSQSASGAPAAVSHGKLPGSATFVEQYVSFDVDEPSFIPQGADYYELLLGDVQTKSSTELWETCFVIDEPPPPQTHTLSDRLRELKQSESRKGNADEPEDDLWNDILH